MLTHLLLFKLRPETPEAALKGIVSKFAECKARVDGFTELHAGPNVSPKNLGRGYKFAVVMTFTDQSALDEYNVLEEHREAQKLQEPWVEEVLVFDIESEQR